MSWSLQKNGSKEQVAKDAAEAFDAAAKSYEGKEEWKDVMACKERALVAVAEFPEEDLAPDSDSPKGYDVNVYAYGSHGWRGGWLSMNVTVDRKKRE